MTQQILLYTLQSQFVQTDLQNLKCSGERLSKEHQNGVTSLKEQRSISWILFWISESGALAVIWDWLSDSKCSAQVDRTQPRSVIKLLLTSILSGICLLMVEDQNWHGCFSQNILSRFWILLSKYCLSYSNIAMHFFYNFSSHDTAHHFLVCLSLLPSSKSTPAHPT